MKLFYLLIVGLLLGCSFVNYQNSFISKDTIPIIKDKVFISSDGYKHYVERWKCDGVSEIILIGIHGYSDYSNSFKIPAKFLNKFGIDFYAFDLRGFGRDANRGVWFDKEMHLNDVYEFLLLVKSENPNKKFFILGESMGGAIVMSLVRQKNLSINGLIFVAPAIWNFQDQNFFLSKILLFFSKIFPNLSLSGKNLLSVKPSDNIAMLQEFSNDPNVIHGSSLSSLQGITNLMTQSYYDASVFLKNPKVKTLIVLPIKDYIVPRKPLQKILEDKQIRRNVRRNDICLGIYDNHYHMILRDIDGDRVTREIKEWIISTDVCDNLISFSRPFKRLEKSDYYHILDKN